MDIVIPKISEDEFKERAGLNDDLLLVLFTPPGNPDLRFARYVERSKFENADPDEELDVYWSPTSTIQTPASEIRKVSERDLKEANVRREYRKEPSKRPTLPPAIPQDQSKFENFVDYELEFEKFKEYFE